MDGSAPAPLTAGQALVRLLAAHGVEVVFGMPGVHTLELYRGLPGSGLRHVSCRHEQGAAFMADGYARVTGEPGVCFLITGPGLTNAITPIAGAFADSVPMLVISSDVATAHRGRGQGFLHDSPDQRAITASITGASLVAQTPEDIPELLARAFAEFRGGRPRPVHIAVPLDVLAAPIAHDWTAEVAVCPAPGPAPTASIDEAVRLLAQAERPVVIAGGGARGCGDRIDAVARSLEAPVFTTVAARDLVDPDRPLWAGSTLCTPAGWDAIAEADVVLAVGTELAETDAWRARLPIDGDLVRVDVDPAKMNDHYPCTVALCGDAGATLAELSARLPSRARSSNGWGVERVEALHRRIDADLGPRERLHARVLRAVADLLPPGAFVAADMTQIAYTANYLFPPGRARHWLHPTGYGTLGYALPAAIGARVARPQRPGLVLVGDGGLLMCVQELATAVEEPGAPLVVLLWNNGALGQILEDMVDRGIEPLGVTPKNPDFQLLVRAFGCRAERPSDLVALRAALTAAFRDPGITVIELEPKAVRECATQN